MSKRPTLIGAASAAKKRVDAAASATPARGTAPPPPPPAATVEPSKGRNRDLTDAGATTAIHIPRDDLVLLRRVAVERANRLGGRPSVSDVLRELINRHRGELEKETGR